MTALLDGSMLEFMVMSSEAMRPIRRSLLSVSDKEGADAFARDLQRLGIELVSTGGTAAFLRDLLIPTTSVSAITGFPEILEGRVKTLHPAIHGGILANLDQGSHRDALAAQSIEPIGLVAVNLYPFETVMKTQGADPSAMIENIDIGGVALLRAAAKNYGHVTVVCDPADYRAVIDELDANGGATTLDTRRRLAAKAFQHTAAYDAAIAQWFATMDPEQTPQRLSISGRLKQTLRYGENPHQTAALYEIATTGPTIVGARQVQGKELSYNNLTDADSAFDLISEFAAAIPAAVIVKHANPCGVAIGSGPIDAYRKALACDPASAFGGIVALNQRIDEDMAREMLKLFVEVVIAPDASPEAQRAFATKPGVRLLLTGGLAGSERHSRRLFRSISGGFLVQDADEAVADEIAMRTVTKTMPTPGQKADALFAMRVAKHVRSNAIVFAKDGATLGIGAGQMSRVDSVRLAVWKARNAAVSAGRDPDAVNPLAGSALASDAFFPFADGLLTAVDAGATVVIQPGGSIRDEEIIAAADERGIAMIFTGIRHFRH